MVWMGLGTKSATGFGASESVRGSWLRRAAVAVGVAALLPGQIGVAGGALRRRARSPGRACRVEYLDVPSP